MSSVIEKPLLEFLHEINGWYRLRYANNSEMPGPLHGLASSDPELQLKGVDVKSLPNVTIAISVLDAFTFADHPYRVVSTKKVF